MNRFLTFLPIGIFLAIIGGCSIDSAEKTRYDMEKLIYRAGRLAERIDIQPQLAGADDSLQLKIAYESVIGFYHSHKNDPAVAGNPVALREMQRMALTAQMQLIRYYTARTAADSVIAAYRRVGNELPAGKDDLTAAHLGLAMTYRSLGLFDSTLAIYDRVMAAYYPPLDSLNRVNTDIAAIPIDRIKIGGALKDASRLAILTREAFDYYDRLRREFPTHQALLRTAKINTARVYTLTEQWDQAIDQLQQIKDSTGQLEIPAAVLIANMLNGPKKQPDRAIAMYRQILARKPDSSVIGSTMLQLGVALVDQKQFDEGRKVLADLKEKFARYPRLVAPAQAYYAQSFEVQGRWDRALSEYQWLMESYPHSEEAYRAAAHIPEHFAQERDQKMADIWYDRIADFYLRSAQVKQGQPAAAVAYSYLAELYRTRQDWSKALETLDRIYAIVPKTNLGAKALYNAARVAYLKLADSTLAQSYLDRLEREFGTTDSSTINREEKTDFSPESIQ